MMEKNIKKELCVCMCVCTYIYMDTHTYTYIHVSTVQQKLAQCCKSIIIESSYNRK